MPHATLPGGTAAEFAVSRGALILLVLAVAGCRPAAAPRAHGRVGAERPGAGPVLRAAGVPEPLSLVRPEMTYGELVATRPGSRHAVGIGREEEVDGWLAWYFFDDPAPPARPSAPVTPGDLARDLGRWLDTEPAAGQRMRRAEFRRPAVRARDARKLWADAVADAQRAAGTAARCYAFEVEGDQTRRGVEAHVPLAAAAGAPARRVVIGTATAVPAAGRERLTPDPPGAEPAAFIVTAEVVPEPDVFAMMHTGQVGCPPPTSNEALQPTEPEASG